MLKPGFLAFLKDPFDPKPIDIVVFDVLPALNGNGDSRVSLAKEVNDHNPLRHYFRVSNVLIIYFLEAFSILDNFLSSNYDASFTY